MPINEEREPEWMVFISDTLYNDLSPEFRALLMRPKKIYPDEHRRLYETDPEYKKKYKEYHKAKKAVEKHTFDARHKK